MKQLFQILTLVLVIQACAQNGEVLVNVDDAGVILEGHDMVELYDNRQVVKGDANYKSEYGYATYYFASQANKVTFDSDPVKYTPRYGGYCSVAAANKKVEGADVNYSYVHNGTLYLVVNAKAAGMWEANPDKIVQAADKNWPKLVKKHGEPLPIE